VVPAFASGNVGTAYNISGSIYEGGVWTGYTCASVHETVLNSGIVQDKQSCTLAAGSPLPAKPTTSSCLTGGAWISDYWYATDGSWVYATSCSMTITPTGSVTIVSLYPAPAL
jgi:hypothetical protein